MSERSLEERCKQVIVDLANINSYWWQEAGITADEVYELAKEIEILRAIDGKSIND